MNIQSLFDGFNFQFLTPYGKPVVTICIATYIIIWVYESIAKKYKLKNLNLHSWFKVAITVISSIAYIFITEKFIDIQTTVNHIINSAGKATLAYNVVIKYFVIWIQGFITKEDDTKQPPATPPDTSGSQLPNVPPFNNGAVK